MTVYSGAITLPHQSQIQLRRCSRTDNGHTGKESVSAHVRHRRRPWCHACAMPRWGVRALIGVAVAIAVIAIAVLVMRGGNTNPEAGAPSAASSPIVAVPSQPSGLPSVMPSGDPYQPPSSAGPAPSGAAGPTPPGPATPPPPGPLGPPPSPGAPTSAPRPGPPSGPTGPAGPTSAGRVNCSITLLPGPSSTTVRMVLQTTPDVQEMWLLIRDRGIERQDVVQVSAGFAERVLSDLSRVSATVTAFSSPDRSPSSRSCQFG